MEPQETNTSISSGGQYELLWRLSTSGTLFIQSMEDLEKLGIRNKEEYLEYYKEKFAIEMLEQDK